MRHEQAESEWEAALLQQDIKVHCREGVPRSLCRKKIATPFVNKITPSDHSWRPNSTARAVSAPWKHPPLMPLLMQPANTNMTVMLRARNRYQHHFVLSAPARGWGRAHLELGTLTQAVKEHFHHRNSWGSPVGRRQGQVPQHQDEIYPWFYVVLTQRTTLNLWFSLHNYR